MSGRSASGFTLVEVLVALMIVAMGLAALMVAVSGTARTSGYLRDKSLAQWIALNRITEVRLNLTKSSKSTDVGELQFGGRTWHFDTRYAETSIPGLKRVLVRVYAGGAKTKGNPLAEAASFLGNKAGPGTPGQSDPDWRTSGGTPQGSGAPGNGPAVGAPSRTPSAGVRGLTPSPPTP